MFIAHEHLLIAILILLLLAVIGMAYSARAGANSKYKQLTGELDFARRHSTAFRYKKADGTIQRVFLLSREELELLTKVP